VVFAVVVGTLALAAAGCGSGEHLACAPLEYERPGSPALILASDLPLQGAERVEARQINDAIRAELKARGFKAGDHTVGFQACDDSTAAAGHSDPGKCAANANEYANNPQVIAVIGPLDSRCATALIPVLNQAPDGAIPIVSATNTYPCLTRGGAGCDLTEPGKYYPSGKRNYVRVIANDVFQAAALAEFAGRRGVRKVFVLHDREAYGVGMATSFRRAAEHLGLEVVGFEGWDSSGRGYTALFDKVASTGADAVFLGGLIDTSSSRLINDKVAVLGPNDGSVKLLAPDGFERESTIAAAGTAANGMYVAAVGVTAGELPEAARAFAAKLGRNRLDARAIYGGQAAAVMLDAIARSDGTREDVIEKLFATHVTNGLLGAFRFDQHGDPVAAAGPIVGFTILEAAPRLEVAATIYPRSSTVRAAARS
jgi:branched-chain amino acid transport system substrate-binding protein